LAGIVTYAWAGSIPDLDEAIMNHSNSPANESAFPAMFVVLSTFIGVLIWLCVLLASLPQY
jgi:hypothetical protein